MSTAGHNSMGAKNKSWTYAYYEGKENPVVYKISGALLSSDIEKTGLKRLEIGESVSGLNKNALADCLALTSISVPKSVTYCDSNTFNNCSSLQRVDIYDLAAWLNISFSSSSANPVHYAKHLYLNNELLTDVVIHYNYDGIKPFVFDNCTDIRSVKFLANADFLYFASYASIGTHAFYGCTSLSSINLPQKLSSIADYAFSSCSSLISASFPTMTIGQCAFGDCYSLSNISLYDYNSRALIIQNYAFDNCYSLANADFLYYAKRIDFGAFNNCYSLLSINFSPQLTGIYEGGNPFFNCYNLSSIKMTSNFNSSLCCDNYNAIIHRSTNAIITGCKNTIIPDGINLIDVNAFYGCTGLLSINLPNTISDINANAFRDCNNLSLIKLSNNLRKIGGAAFENCSNLNCINIPSDLSLIGTYAFVGCTSLSSISCNALTAPKILNDTFGYDNFNYTGRNTYSTGTNTLYIPQNSTGYNSSYWSSVLLNSTKCGFHTSYIQT